MRTDAVNFIRKLFALFALVAAFNVYAAADLEVNTPGVNAIKASMQARHAQLVPYYNSGAVGIGMDGMVAICSAGAVPLSQRQEVNALVIAENHDREALYAEIANANGHPEWHNEVRQTFAQRWIQLARPGWWILTDKGWVQK